MDASNLLNTSCVLVYHLYLRYTKCTQLVLFFVFQNVLCNLNKLLQIGQSLILSQFSQNFPSFADSSIATATATVIPTIGLLPKLKRWILLYLFVSICTQVPIKQRLNTDCIYLFVSICIYKYLSYLYFGTQNVHNLYTTYNANHYSDMIRIFQGTFQEKIF